MMKGGARIPLDPIAPTYHQQEDRAGVIWLVKSHSMVSHYATCPSKKGSEQTSFEIESALSRSTTQGGLNEDNNSNKDSKV